MRVCLNMGSYQYNSTIIHFVSAILQRKLLQRSLDEVPPKNRALVVLECARLEEYANNLDKARKILAKARKEARFEWRVFLESVLVEMRAGNTAAAIREAQDALTIHPGNGRLWAVLIQLKRAEGREVRAPPPTNTPSPLRHLSLFIKWSYFPSHSLAYSLICSLIFLTSKCISYISNADLFLFYV